MPMQALEQFERRFRLLEQIVGKNIEKRVRLIEQHFEEKVERPFRLFEQRIGRNIGTRLRRFEQKNGIRLNDEVRFIGSWIKKPLSMGAVTPSSKALARAMARYVDPDGDGPVIELGPGTGPVTEALIEHGVNPVAARAARVQSDVLRAAAAALPRGDRRACRCLPAAGIARQPDAP